MTPRERFLHYVTYYTTSDDFSETAPSTERQKELIRELAREMEELGLKDISFDSNSNVYGTLPANVKGAPSTALIAHVDTAPDAPGENVRPAVITCPEGEFTLESGVVMNEALCPGLSKHVGEELIVTDGTTLLGADDKAGVAEIMSAVDRLMESGRPHGEVKVIFTTDEEVGRGAEGIDVKALGCDFGYTVDGGPIGAIEYENFDAASAVPLLEELLEKLREGRSLSSSDVWERLAATVACKAAIKGGWVTEREELLALAEKVLAGEVTHCPHGRPVMTVFTRAELDKRFGRIV